jgi:hypothetical protein
MNLKHRYYVNRVWEDAGAENLVRNRMTGDGDETQRMEDLIGLVARMLDALPLTDQQKLDIIDPCSVWEIVEEPK